VVLQVEMNPKPDRFESVRASSYSAASRQHALRATMSEDSLQQVRNAVSRLSSWPCEHQAILLILLLTHQIRSQDPGSLRDWRHRCFSQVLPWSNADHKQLLSSILQGCSTVVGYRMRYVAESRIGIAPY